MNAPLSQWHEADSFETLEACEEARSKLSATLYFSENRADAHFPWQDGADVEECLLRALRWIDEEGAKQ